MDDTLCGVISTVCLVRHTRHLPYKHSFSWLSATVAEGRRRQLQVEDMFPLPKFDDVQPATDQFAQVWDRWKQRTPRPRAAFFRAALQVVGPREDG